MWPSAVTSWGWLKNQSLSVKHGLESLTDKKIRGLLVPCETSENLWVVSIKKDYIQYVLDALHFILCKYAEVIGKLPQYGLH